MVRIVIAFALLCIVHALPPAILTTTNGTTSPITFITVETRGHPWLTKIGHFPEAVLNVADGKAWPQVGIYRLKVQLISKWLESQPSSHIVAFVDGDVFWGGCSMTTFLEAYHQIVQQSGAKIIFGAELGCTDQDCSRAPSVPKYAEWCNTFWAGHAQCPAFWDKDCAGSRSCTACNNPPTAMFLNPGFIMGPAGHLYKMTLVANSRFPQWKTSSGGDQGVFAEYWLQNQKLVTLDYEGKLVMSLAYMSPNATEVDKKTGAIFNKVRNQTQCFIHGNGKGKPTALQIAKDMGFEAGTLQVKGIWPPPPAMLQEKKSVNAFGEMVSAVRHEGQPSRRLARRHEPSSAASSEVAEERVLPSEADELHMEAHSFRTEEVARRMWRGQ